MGLFPFDGDFDLLAVNLRDARRSHDGHCLLINLRVMLVPACARDRLMLGLRWGLVLQQLRMRTCA